MAFVLNRETGKFLSLPGESRTMAGIVTLLGIEHNVNIKYRITSYGTSASYEEPGDPPEIEIDAVIGEYGTDLTRACQQAITKPDFRVAHMTRPVGEWSDPIGEVLFGLRGYWPSVTGGRVKGTGSRRVILNQSETVMSQLHDYVYAE